MGVHEIRKPELESVFHKLKANPNAHQIDRNNAVIEISNIIKQQYNRP